MKALSLLTIGVVFGITLFKSEAASWFRIFEMFQFDSFHMYGIIGSALAVGVVLVFLIKRTHTRSFYGDAINIIPKEKSFSRYMYGGIIFGLGWGLAGACPGPIFVLAGAGYLPVMVVMVSAVAGTLVYGIFKKYLPH